MSASIVCCASLLTACSDSSSSSSESDKPSKNSSLQVGSYVLGLTIYSMGEDGAARLADAYDKVDFQHVVLLVKGESGTIGYFKNSLSNAPKTRIDRKRLTASKSEGGYDLTLDEYNELVKIMAQQFGYPTKKNEDGRLVYDGESENSPDVVDFALDTAYNKGVKGVLAFAKMRENIIDDISEFLVKQTNKPVYVASMPECSSYPIYATINYGLTFNKAYTYDVVCPMLYSVDYEEDVSWVSRNVEYLKNLGYPKILPSLLAYKESSTEALAADVKAVVDHDLLGYLLFRTGTYDIARAVRKDKKTVELTYVRGASPKKVAMGGKLADTKSSVKGGQIVFKADALEEIGDYCTVSISVGEEKNVSVNVTADGCIVYNAPME